MNQPNDNQSKNKLTPKQRYNQEIGLTKQQLINSPGINWAIAVISLVVIALAAIIFFEFTIRNSKLTIDYKTISLLITAIILAGVVIITKKTRTVVLSILGIGITGLFIQFLSSRGLQGSAVLYVGLPLLLAYVFKSYGTSGSNTGSILKGLSIVMLLSAPILQEGFICILMAAPLFYIIGGIVGLILNSRKKKQLSKLQASPLLLIVALMSLEGTHPALTFERQNTVRVEKVVLASSDAIKNQLNKPLVLGNDVPAFLKIFPFPTSQ